MASTKLVELFTDIADALRSKGGTSDKIKASDFPTAIENLPSGGGGDITYEDGELTLTDSARSVSFTVENEITDATMILFVPSLAENMTVQASCVAFLYHNVDDSEFLMYSNNTTNTGWSYAENLSSYLTIDGNTITFTTPFAYRLLKAMDYTWRVLYN